MKRKFKPMEKYSPIREKIEILGESTNKTKSTKMGGSGSWSISFQF